MKVLVTGGRDFTDRALVIQVLDQLHAEHVFTHLIHGDASGADRLCDDWCATSGVQPVACRALWDYYRSVGKHKMAGPMRNLAMAALAPDLVVVFPGGIGTAHMAMVAEARGFKVVRAEQVVRK